ncbi:uncharacterized protein LOC109718928 [Ananas comosus]|uniref:Uncharacterized protein LOC109718928 n=1 Tax=Ananas comosus TaxID=4615 RepID=A0A6P5FXD8_ANACO|nr:uncharacterized protein LOC109718928 [Ananas comosus]
MPSPPFSASSLVASPFRIYFSPACPFVPDLPLRPLSLPSPRLLLRRAPPLPRGSSRRRAAANSGAPPPPGGDSDDLSGLQERISRVQDRVRIFFAVLFWMSLFFWASACDGRDKPRNKKKFRFRK